MYVKEVGCEVFELDVYLAQERIKWWFLILRVMCFITDV